MKVALYIIGSLLLMGGLLLAGSTLGLSQTWLIVIALGVLGLGVMGAVSATGSSETSD